MLFNSFQFLLFFPIVVGLYFALPGRWRWLHLLVASYLFYMAWEPAYALLMLASTVADFVAAQRLHRAHGPARKRWLALSLSVNLGLLFSFKYYDLVNSTFAALTAAVGLAWPLPESSLLLPVGISFYTFQTLGYTLDVYRSKIEPERHFGRFALYVSYFPQLVAGPIERAGRLLPQLEAIHHWDTARVGSGLRLMLWGLFKKVVVADRLALVVDAIYTDPSAMPGPLIVLGTALFGYQLYCDFSGYSDLAIGAARVMGVDLMKNFDQPHFARSVGEFWSRWHISLMSWMRDYIYIPLGGNRFGPTRTLAHVLVVFGVSGLWHGAQWTLVVWGMMNGLFVVMERITQRQRDALAKAVGLSRLPLARRIGQSVATVGLVWFSFIVFRSSTGTHALQAMGQLMEGWGLLGSGTGRDTLMWMMRVDGWTLAYMVALCPVVEVSEYLQRTSSARAPISWVSRSVLDVLLILSIALLGRFGSDAFIYFQF